MTTNRLFAAIVLALCLVLLLRLAVGERQRAAFDARVRGVGEAMRQLALALPGWLAGRRKREAATREAQDLIDRARRNKPELDRDGNVIRPRQFGDRRKDLH